MIALPFASDHVAPDKRARFVPNGVERKICEGAVQVAVGLWVLGYRGSDGHVTIYPDGEHGKRYDIRGALETRGFVRTEALGSTSYGGVYRAGNRSITVNPRSEHGRGDVVGELPGRAIRIECKGGTINSKHSGVASRLRSGLAELIGQAMAMEDNGDLHLVAMPRTEYTARLASRIAQRCRLAGIDIALVDEDGSIGIVD